MCHTRRYSTVSDDMAFGYENELRAEIARLRLTDDERAAVKRAAVERGIEKGRKARAEDGRL